MDGGIWKVIQACGVFKRMRLVICEIIVQYTKLGKYRDDGVYVVALSLEWEENSMEENNLPHIRPCGIKKCNMHVVCSVYDHNTSVYVAGTYFT